MLSHVNDDNNPQMVDVGHKHATHRRARARATVKLTSQIMRLLQEGELQSKKGPVFQTAILAGIMAAKRTHELIPLCHPIPMEDCKIRIVPGGPDSVVIDCEARATFKTGVEMEALTGASVAALTIYDMCKAMSHAITIESVGLIEKTGGKSDFHAQEGA